MRSSSRSSERGGSVRLAVATLLLLLLASGPAAATDAGTGGTDASGDAAATFGISPARDGSPDGRPGLLYNLEPGGTTRDEIVLLNYSSRPLTVEVYPADAYNTATGAFAVGDSDDPSTGVASWLRLGIPAGGLRLEPAAAGQPSRRAVPVLLHVPARAEPGDHAGGILVSLPTEARNAAGDRVRVEQRVGTRIYVRVGGPTVARLEVSDVTVAPRGAWPLAIGSAEVSWTVRNTGNLRLGGSQLVRLAGLPTLSWRADAAPLPELLPGSEVRLTARVGGVVTLGRLTATVTVTPRDAYGTTYAPVAATGDRLVIPWALVALLLMLAGALRLRRRRAGVPLAPVTVEGARHASVPVP